MLHFLQEEDIWTRLSGEKRPIFLYGMGNGAEKILHEFSRCGIRAAGLFASDEFVRGHSFRGYPVRRYADICAEYPDFLVVLAFATHDPAVLARIAAMHQEHEVLAPDVPVAGEGIFNRAFMAAHEAEFAAVYDLLADDISRYIYAQVLNFKISGKVDYLFHSATPKEEVYTSLLRVGPAEYFVDLGAYDGDTIRELLAHTDGQYAEITAIEPDPKNFKKLTRFAQTLEKPIDCRNIGVHSQAGVLRFSPCAGRNSRVLAGPGKYLEVPVDTVDHMMAGKQVSLLKMDVEGCEMEALCGAEETIRSQRPKLYVCAYHRNEDLFALPLKIHELCNDYQIYLRHPPYLPAWETNFYAVCPPRSSIG
ncbi:MAG TPA: FkbM family methyltransferase [Firmicutes bacterium]|nr:FkbM family methyltransferase [Bacillota bacterium]